MAVNSALCWLAARATELWDFVDKRDIDKHAIAWSTFGFTIYLMLEVLRYVGERPEKSGIELAAIIAAVLIPWTPVQQQVFKWYFERNTT